MNKHTPGPWGIEQTHETNWIGFMRPDGRKVDLIVCTTDRYSITNEALERNDANARLIAAAPELLEALVIARDYSLYAQAEAGDLALIDAAIARATGESA